SPKILKWVFRVLLIILNIYPIFLLAAYIFLSPSAGEARPRIPESWVINYFLLYPFWLWTFLVVQCILLFLLIEIIKLLVLPVYRKNSEKFKNIEAKIVLVILAFFMIYVPARVIIDYNMVSTRIVEYKQPNLPDSLNNFKITFISDIQADAYTDAARLGKYINRVNETDPDLVLIGGDMITSTPDYIDEAAEYVGKIKSRYGIYSCIGDHDNWAYRDDYGRSIREVKGAMEKYNVEMLSNKDTVLNIKTSKIGITCITSTYVEHLNSRILDSLIHQQDHSDFKILLVHQPNALAVQKASEEGYNLFLAGHTHGGQVTFLFPFINLTPTLLETRFVRGDFHFGKMLMIVTRGLGMSLVPLRYNSTPEITVIVLRKG
ncbi:MAG TPA: metallophosphoesterase, partial [Ignavibacteriaceae bacterium]|nr:metallophosphoesterase [Ignavibacteriaceae bacterium]